MRCDVDHIPNIGLLGMMMHLSGQRAKQMFEEYDLNKSQASILFTLHQGQALSQKELAERLNVTPPSITSAIQKMEKAGYIKRKPDEKDQRIMRLDLTEKGTACIRHIKEVGMKMDELLFKGITAEERLLLRRLFIQMFENLLDEPKTDSSKPSRKNRD